MHPEYIRTSDRYQSEPITVESQPRQFPYSMLTPCHRWNWYPKDNAPVLVDTQWGKGTKVQVRPLIYEHERGPIPEGHRIRMVCSNKRCVNPEHMRTYNPQTDTVRKQREAIAEWQARDTIGKLTHYLGGQAFIEITTDSKDDISKPGYQSPFSRYVERVRETIGVAGPPVPTPALPFNTVMVIAGLADEWGERFSAVLDAWYRVRAEEAGEQKAEWFRERLGAMDQEADDAKARDLALRKRQPVEAPCQDWTLDEREFPGIA